MQILLDILYVYLVNLATLIPRESQRGVMEYTKDRSDLKEPSFSQKRQRRQKRKGDGHPVGTGKQRDLEITGGPLSSSCIIRRKSNDLASRSVSPLMARNVPIWGQGL